MPPDLSPLDYPIWTSLTTTHAPIALGAGTLARRFPQDIGPLAALAHPTPEAYAALAALTPPEDVAVLFLDAPAAPPSGWELVRDGTLVQMLCPTPPPALTLADPILPLTESDFPEMLALATLTEPGPFRTRTGTLGGFLGIRAAGRLVAMAGRRLAPTGFVEISAVCTHPEARGRGYAQALVAAVARGIFADGLTPFLTSFEHNAAAIRVYQNLGFHPRRNFALAVLKPPQM